MHLDAHYYAILAFAVSCGFKKESAQTLAYASQFVDDAKINQLSISGPTYDISPKHLSSRSLINMSTCHSYCHLKTFNHAAMINNTCAFHFVPGCNGDNFIWKMTCEPEGPIIYKIMDSALEENDLIKFGIALHAWADSYSHKGFSGLLSKPNDIDHLFAEQKPHLSMETIVPRFILWMKRSFFNGSFDNILDRLVPPYGHAQALNYPDEPFIEEWSYDYDKSDIFYKNHGPFFRNNVELYQTAFESIAVLLKKFLRNHPSHLNNMDEGIKSPSDRLFNTLFTRKSSKEREKEWLSVLRNMKPFSDADLKSIKYDDTKWLREAFENYESENYRFTEKSVLKSKKSGKRIVIGAKLKETFIESNWYKYYLGVHWYKKLFHKYCHEYGLAFDHDPYFP
jgi:hypothetical protein